MTEACHIRPDEKGRSMIGFEKPKDYSGGDVVSEGRVFDIKGGSRRKWVLIVIVSMVSLLIATIPAGAEPSGAVEATVSVEGPCLTVSATSVDFGVAALSNNGENTQASAELFNVTNCSSQVQLLFASASDAVGNATGGWTLDQWDESALACAWDTDTFGAALNYTAPPGYPFWLPAGAADMQISTQAGGDTNEYGPLLLMPCTGSSGVGEIMTFGYTLTGVLP
jgi:acyl-CoA hydrolase